MQSPLLSPRPPLKSFTTFHWTDSAPTVCGAASGAGGAEVKGEWSVAGFPSFPTCTALPDAQERCWLRRGQKLSAREASLSPGERGPGGRRLGPEWEQDWCSEEPRALLRGFHGPVLLCPRALRSHCQEEEIQE